MEETIEFCLSTKTLTDKGDLWRNSLIDFYEAIGVLVTNGWSNVEAVLTLNNLLSNREEWILVNDKTQIFIS